MNNLERRSADERSTGPFARIGLTSRRDHPRPPAFAPHGAKRQVGEMPACGFARGGGQRGANKSMEWSDTAIVLSSRAHGETGAILELLTRAHGRHLGLARGGASRRVKPTLQPGNSVHVHWRARL